MAFVRLTYQWTYKTPEIKGLEEQPPDGSGRISSTMPARLADGLGPKRMPYAISMAIRPWDKWVPRSSRI